MKEKLKHLLYILFAALIPIALIVGYYFGSTAHTLPFGFTWKEVTVVGPGSVTESGESVHGFLLIDNEHDKEYLVCDNGVVPFDVDEVDDA